MNAHAYQTTYLGQERESVVVIDNFAPDPLALIEQAVGMSYMPPRSYFPGPRALLPLEDWRTLSAGLAPIVEEVFGCAPMPDASGVFYSLVTTLPHELAPIQRLPHFDGTEPNRFAGILYLTQTGQGGTSFYRHRSTGFESVTEERLQPYGRAIEDDVRRLGMPPAAYMCGDTPLFERIGGVEPVFNRFVLYRGRVLHSGDIAPGFAFDANPRTGRLTLNAFLLS